MNKHIFIGLGGSGINTLAKVKFKIYKSIQPDNGRQPLEIMNDDHRFIFVDTDMNDVNKNNKQYETSYVPNTKLIDSDTEFIDIGQYNPKSIYFNAVKDRSNDKILKAVRDDIANIMASDTLRVGAGAFRIQARLAFDREKTSLLNKIESAIDNMSKQANNPIGVAFDFWVFCSSCGGTGSAILSDVLYMINKAYRSKFPGNDPRIKLILYTPKFYIDKNKNNENYPLNAYAFFTELNTFMQDRYDGKSPSSIMHELSLLQNTGNADWQFKPLSYCIPIDFNTESNLTFRDLSEMYQNTAEMVYYLYRGEGGNTIVSSLVNDATGIFNTINSSKYRNFLIPMGYKALRKPEKEFELYCNKRFIYEILKYGLLGKSLNEEIKEQNLREEYFNKNTIQNVFSLIFSQYSTAMEENFENILKYKIQEIKEDEFKYSLFFDDKDRLKKEVSVNYVQAKYQTAKDEISRVLKKRYHDEWHYKFSSAIKDKLWILLEESIYAYGIQFTADLFYQLDTNCEKQVSNIKERIEKVSLKQNEIILLVEEAKQKYQTSSNNENALNYFNRKAELLEKEEEIEILKLLLDLLNEICFRGNNQNQGIIDDLEVFLGKLNEVIAQKLVVEEKSFTDLSKDFTLLADDVTTSYLPDVTSFVRNGWTHDNLFANLYHSVIKISSTKMIEDGRGYIPFRHHPENPDHLNREGLHKLMYEAISSSGNPDIRQYINQETKKTEIFRFGYERSISEERIIEDVIICSAEYFQMLVKQNQDIKNKWFNKSIVDLYNSLSQTDKDAINNKFKTSGIQLFYNYDKNAQIDADTKFLYVSDDEQNAKKLLGYTNATNEQFVADPSLKNSAYKIKISFSHNLDGYGYISEMKTAYQAARASNRIYHHIHDFFNESGTDLNLLRKKIFNENSALYKDVFLKYLFFDKFSTILQQKDNISDYFFMPHLASQRDNISFSPIFIKSSANSKQIFWANNICEQENKLFFSKRDMIEIYFGEDNYVEYFKKLQKYEFVQQLKLCIDALINNNHFRQKIFDYFLDVKNELIVDLDAKWSNNSSSQDEKAFLSEFIQELQMLSVQQLFNS